MDDYSARLNCIFIAESWRYDRSPENEFNKEMIEPRSKSIKRSSENRTRLEQAKRVYENGVLSMANKLGSEFGKDFEFTSFLTDYGLQAASLDNVHSRYRQLHEKYLLEAMHLEDSGDSIKNWAQIGLELSKDNTKYLSPLGVYLNNREIPKPSTLPTYKRAMGQDYERAVWKLIICGAKGTLVFDDCGYDFDLSVLTLNEILDAYNWAFENPEKHTYLDDFNEMENKLQLRFKSRSSLKTSFSRGERQRKHLWES